METQSLGMVENAKDDIAPIVKSFDANKKKDHSLFAMVFFMHCIMV